MKNIFMALFLALGLGIAGTSGADIESPEDRAAWRATLAPDPDLGLCSVERMKWVVAGVPSVDPETGAVYITMKAASDYRPHGGYCAGEYERK